MFCLPNFYVFLKFKIKTKARRFPYTVPSRWVLRTVQMAVWKSPVMESCLI